MELSKDKIELFEKLRIEKQDDAKVFFKKAYHRYTEGAVDNYAESAHFIYELLQNADDAGATKACVVLKSDQLWFKHNGSKHFDITPNGYEPEGDINAILGFGDSSKKDDVNKIGKFGIGFKSVFQYTDVPEIYDDIFKFRIEKLIIPILLNEDHPYRTDGETLFVIPFKNSDCYTDIEDKLKTIEHPTLFLRNLQSVSILIENDKHEQFRYTKTIDSSVLYGDIIFERIFLENPCNQETILLFSKDLSFVHDEESYTNRISIGYTLKDGFIETGRNKKVNCFFPTSEKFDCSFTIHAPFLLTNSRDRIKRNENHNFFLIRELASLATKSLPFLRDYGIQNSHYLINSNIVELFPRPVKNNSGTRINDEFQIPFIEAFEKIVSTEALFLSRNKTYLKQDESIIANSDDFFDLLTSEQLSQLYPEKKCHIDFLDKAVSNQFDKEKYNFNIPNFTIYNFANKITKYFMANQPMEWVLRLYQFIIDKGNIERWVKGRSFSVGYQVFAQSPIVKCSNGSWISPFKDNNTIDVYYSFGKGSQDNNFNYIDFDYCNSDIAKSFFNKLGVSYPNKLDYINHIVFPRYTNIPDGGIDDELLVSDFSLLLDYYNDSESDDEFCSMVKQKVLFVACDGYLHVPSELFIHLEELDVYFGEYLYIDESYYAKVFEGHDAQLIYRFLNSVGVCFIPKILEDNSEAIFSKSSLSKKFLNCIDDTREYQKFFYKDYVLEGFLDLIRRNGITKDVSIYLWEKVIPEYANKCSLCKFYVYNKRARTVSNTYDVISTFRDDLISTQWVLDINEELQAPKDLFKENINECYFKNDVVYNFLDIKETHHEITDLGGTVEQQDRCNKGRHFDGCTEEEAKRARELLDQEKQQKSIDSTNQEQKNIPVESALDRHNKRMDRLNSMPNIHPHLSDPAESTVKQSSIDDIDFTINSDINLSDPIKRAERNIKAEATRTQKEAFEASDNKELLAELERSEKFTFKWYKLLMNLMHSKKQSGIYKSEIRFANAVVKNNVVTLQDANVPIPEWFADASTFRVVAIANGSTSDVSCTFMKADDDRMEISVSNARDVDLLCNAKVIKVVAENKHGFIESLQSRFVKLAFEEDFSLQQNFPSNVSFVYGPPGTGKTTYLANEIKSLIDANSKISILVLTPTNKAADVIAEKIINFDECLSLVTRYGTTESQLLIDSGVLGNRDSFDISDSDRNVVVTTAARYPYDYMQPDNAFLCEHMWDYVIIDEASMIDIITSSFIVFNSSKSKIIISGDPFQIQPVSQNDMPAYNIYDLVELKDFSKAVSGVDYKSPIKTLTKQYRSINSIGKLVSNFTYDGLLQSDENRICTQYLSFPGLPINEINFIEYNIWDDDLLHGVSTVNGSAFHLYAAIFTYNMVKHIVNVLSASSGYHTIGIVCPYKAEADAIQRMLEISDINSPSCNVLVGTVHSFQGDECDIMFVVINPPKTISSGVHINNKNILNVAISRARDYLFFVAPKGYSKSPLGNLCNKEKSSTFSTSFAEKIMFEDENYIEQNVSVSFHSNVNVYKETSCKYDVRISDNAIDITINE